MYRWHLFGVDSERKYLFGPSMADDAMARSLAGILGLPYVQSWDHEPTAAEVAEVLN